MGVDYVFTVPKIRLSDREMEILNLIADGNNLDTISKKLEISKRTTEAHCAKIRRKMVKA